MSSQDADRSDDGPTPSPSPIAEPAAPLSSPPPGLLRNSGPAPARRSTPTIPPSAPEDLAEVFGQRGDDDFSPERAIDDQIAELEAWAWANVKAERLDNLRFWGMRVLAFLGAASAAAAAALHQTELAVTGGILAAFAVVVDAAWPSVGDRIARRRAIHDLREFQHHLRIKWDKVRLAHPNPNAPKRIAHALVLLDHIQNKREEIGRYLGDAPPGVARLLD
jgi:hypothetical protein